MTTEEYDNSIKKIEKEMQEKRTQLIVEYAFSNNPYNNGDVIKDHMGSLKIEKIKAYLGLNNYPECIYYGIRLNKDGTPQKKLPHLPVHQSNITKP